MKKFWGEKVRRVTSLITCTALILSIMLGINPITARAAAKKWNIDLSNGKTAHVTNGRIDELASRPKSDIEAVMLLYIMMLNDKDHSNSDFGNAESITTVLSTDPYQGLTITRSNKDFTFRAAENSIGTGEYSITRQAIIDYFRNRPNHNNESATEFGDKIMYAFGLVVDGKGITDDTELIVSVKYSDAPVKTESTVGSDPVASFEVGTEIENNGIKYRIIDKAGNLSAIALTAQSKSVEIPDSVVIDKYTLNVTDIAQGFMKGNKKTKSVTIGSNVNSIGKQAFYKCKKLKKVKIKSTNITSIGKKAFGKNAKGFTLKMPKNCKKAYKKLLKKAGIKTVNTK